MLGSRLREIFQGSSLQVSLQDDIMPGSTKHLKDQPSFKEDSARPLKIYDYALRSSMSPPPPHSQMKESITSSPS